MRYYVLIGIFLLLFFGLLFHLFAGPPIVCSLDKCGFLPNCQAVDSLGYGWRWKADYNTIYACEHKPKSPAATGGTEHEK